MNRRLFLNKVGLSASVASILSLIESNATEHLEAATKLIDNSDARAIAKNEDYWRSIQQCFSVSRSLINLNHAGVCSSPDIVTDAVIHLIKETEKVPAHFLFDLFEPRLETVRAGLAKLLGADPEEVAIVRNTTEAMHSILLGSDLKRGDEILTTNHDYWGMLDALRQRKLRDGIQIKMVPVPVVPEKMGDLVEIFEKGITSKTKLILVSHPVNLTGQLFPIKQICEMAHAKGIEVALDAAQSFAQIDYKITDFDCDYFATSLHKWLMGPKVTGLLYMKREKIAKTWPVMPAPAGYENDIRKFERMGTISAKMLAIAQALIFHNGIGTLRKEERFRYLTNYWVNNVKDLPNVRFNTVFEPEMSCAIANFYIDGVDESAFTRYLFEKHNIYVVPINRKRAVGSKGVRVSPSLPNTLEELDLFCNVVEHVARKGLPD